MSLGPEKPDPRIEVGVNLLKGEPWVKFPASWLIELPGKLWKMTLEEGGLLQLFGIITAAAISVLMV